MWTTHAPSGDGAAKPSLVVSDVHIGAVGASTEMAFLDFLYFAAETAHTLIINGDLFDVGPLDARWRAPAHSRVLKCLADAVASGLAISFVGGNRDPVEWCGPALADVGVSLWQDPARMLIGRRHALVAHGDGARHGAARPYTKPYPWLRHRALVGTAHRLRLAPHLHRLLSNRSPTAARAAAAARGASTGPKVRAPAVEAWARGQLEADAHLDLVVAGHSHLPALVEFALGRYYVNSGDWISHYTYVVVPADDAPPVVRYWPSRAPVDWHALHDAEVPLSARQRVER
jgi:UDP-2,3-diacylglucosamine hydrolase